MGERSIAGFGGRSGHVISSGQSGGGGKVSTLMAAPSHRGSSQAAVPERLAHHIRRPKVAQEVAAEVLRD